MTAINPKNQVKVNKCVKTLEKYYTLNDMRDAADDSGDSKAYNKYNKQCESVFDKYLELFEALPKYEQKQIEKI